MIGAEAVSHRGLVRETNQDACCVLVAHTSLGTLSMAIVCDGVGGLSQGELASSYVTNRFATWFEQELAQYVGRPSFVVEQIDVIWEDLIQSLHEEIRSYGKRMHEELGTTFTGVMVCQGRYLAVQVGDSRMYMLHDGNLSQITEDQTVAAQNAAVGELAGGVGRRLGGNVILQAIGAGREVHPQFTCGECADRDLFVLCSDGIYSQIDDIAIKDCLVECVDDSTPNFRACCERMVEKALAAGGHDNVSALCLLADPLNCETHGTLVVGIDEPC